MSGNYYSSKKAPKAILIWDKIGFKAKGITKRELINNSKVFKNSIYIYTYWYDSKIYKAKMSKLWKEILKIYSHRDFFLN